jgi:hypothetical protein
MPHLILFVGAQLLYKLNSSIVGGINYSTNPSPLSQIGAHHLSITERIGGKHYDFFVRTADECQVILDQIIQAAVKQQDVTIVFDPDINSNIQPFIS